MRVLGQKVKDVRKSKKISQAELAKGICTQATISNIETRNLCDSLDIFSQICLRLEMTVDDFLIKSDEQKAYELLENVEELCNLKQHNKAYKLLRSPDIELSDSNILLKNKYNYYMGLTIMLSEKKQTLQDALFYFYNSSEIEEQLNIYNILSINAIGTYYALKNDYDKAKVYHQKSIDLLNRFNREMPSIGFKIFYNSAHFYSLIKEHQKSIDLCKKGIALNKKANTMDYLEQLYYELAYNKYKLNQPSSNEYQTAFFLAKHSGNTACMKQSYQNIVDYNIPIDLSTFVL